MISRLFLPRACGRLSSAAVLCLAVGLFPALARQAAAQAVPASTWPTGDTDPAEQPLAGQQLGTDLSLNQGIQSLTAENESFNRYGLGLEASGGVITNFFGTQTNPTTAAVAEVSGQAGIRLRSARTRYFAYYAPQYNMYPAYSEVNNYAQRFYQVLTHEITEHTGVAWSTTAARYLSLNQYLPQNLNIGGVGVVAPTLGSVLRADSFQITNVATSIRYRYLMSTRMTFTGTLVGGYFLTVPIDYVRADFYSSERFITTGADLRLDYQWRPRDQIGVEVTPIYIYGLQPSGHVVAETVQATYQRQVTEKLQARVGAGPLFVQGSSPAFGKIQDTSYAINASLSRQIRQSQFAVLFNRAFVVNLLSPAVLSNGLGGSAYIPFQRSWILIGAATYVHDSGTGNYGSANVYGAQAQLAYQLGTKVQLFARYNVLSQNFNRELSTASYGFTRNQIGGGIRFNLGNPTTRGGVQ